MSAWTSKGQNNWSLITPSKVTLEDFPVLDTTGCARILRGADQAGHEMEVDMQSHSHQIVSINLVAFIKRFLDVRFGNF